LSRSGKHLLRRRLVITVRPSSLGLLSRFTQFNTCSALVVVYDYHPNAETLFSLHLKPKPPTFQNGRLQQSKDTSLIPEQTLWSYIIQLASAMQVIHDAGLAVRLMDPTKILVTGKNR